MMGSTERTSLSIRLEVFPRRYQRSSPCFHTSSASKENPSANFIRLPTIWPSDGIEAAALRGVINLCPLLSLLVGERPLIRASSSAETLRRSATLAKVSPARAAITLPFELAGLSNLGESGDPCACTPMPPQIKAKPATQAITFSLISDIATGQNRLPWRLVRKYRGWEVYAEGVKVPSLFFIRGAPPILIQVPLTMPVEVLLLQQQTPARFYWKDSGAGARGEAPRLHNPPDPGDDSLLRQR